MRMKYADKSLILDSVTILQGDLAVQEKRFDRLSKLFDRINGGATPVNFPSIRHPNLALGRELAPVRSMRRLSTIYHRAAEQVAANQLDAQADLLLLEENRKHLIVAGLRFWMKKALMPENDDHILQLQTEFGLLDEIINDQFEDLEETSTAHRERFNNTFFAVMYENFSLQFEKLRQEHTANPLIFRSSEDQDTSLDVALLGEESVNIALTDSILRQVFIDLYMANEAKRLFVSKKINEELFLLILEEHIDTAFENLEIAEENIDKTKETLDYIEEKVLSSHAFPENSTYYTTRTAPRTPQM